MSLRRLAVNLAASTVLVGWLLWIAFAPMAEHETERESDDEPGVDRAPEINVWAREYRTGRRWA